MIIPIFPPLQQLSLNIVKNRLKEAQTAEDADFVVIPINLTEEAPICKFEQELRDYIRGAKITRKITHLFVHCTASQPHTTVSSIQNHWRTLGWKNPGYHILLTQDGFTVLLDFNGVSNGVAGFNSHGVHISYIGGIDKNGKALDTRTEMQKRLIEVFIEEMVRRFPNIKVLGHNEAPNSNKACPSFLVKKEYPKYWTGI
jgi:N-acetylmuramoyl-L-alanine amidase